MFDSNPLLIFVESSESHFPEDDKSFCIDEMKLNIVPDFKFIAQ